MKGKALNLKIIISILMVLITGLIYGLSLNLNSSKKDIFVAASTKVSLGMEGAKEEYSALFRGDIIFSAEKVRVNSKEYKCVNTTSESEMFLPKDITGGKEFLAGSQYHKYVYDNKTWEEDCEKVYVLNEGTYVLNKTQYVTDDKYKEYQEDIDYFVLFDGYTFKDVPSVNSSKTVIDNGGFAKLDNVYRNGRYSLESEEGYQEAILVSFGSYVYLGENSSAAIARNDDTDTDADETLYAGITYLQVAIKKNGIALTKNEIPEIRNIAVSEGPFFDFDFLITQDENNSNEGYYEFSFNYMVNNKYETANFSFYLINNTSYTKSTNEDFGYNAKPTLGWIEGGSDQNFEKNQVNDYVRYLIGSDGINEGKLSYPTITYDYTKYKLKYTHTANQKTNVYELGVEYTQNANNKEAKLQVKISNSDGVLTEKYALNDYAQHQTNLVTIMLTEPGTYVAEYDFLYDGYVGAVAPDPAFETEELKLAIHGLSAYYSKSGYEGAKMQYFEIAKSSANQVDLIIPNGYQLGSDTSSKRDEKLGFAYTLVDSTEREGTILENSDKKHTNALANEYLKNNSNYDNLISIVTTNLSTQGNNKVITLDVDELTIINEILSDLATNGVYAKTNQGSLWIEGDDEYSSSSFYFYSPSALSASGLFKAEGEDYKGSFAPFTNTTSFNSKGYYLVFTQVVPGGLSTSSSYWQVFAFQYTSSSANIKIETNEDGKITTIANGKYTNKEVVVSWEKPGVFDRTINAYYYSAVNKNLTKEELLKTKAEVLNATEDKDGILSVTLGSNVAENTFVRYLIRLESGGEKSNVDKNEIESATYKLFTIDKQGISNIKAYLIQEMYSGNSVYYSYATDSKNIPIEIGNAVTDGYASLSWKDKESGANIYATYSYTPFAVSTDEEDASKVINGNGGAKWISTNYKLGTTIDGASIYKSSSPYLVDSECVLFNQGIYIVDLEDEAGNKSKYAFVIDRTENYFSVEGECVSNASLLYGDNVKFSIGEYKVFDLNIDHITDETTDQSLKDLREFIQKAAANRLDTFENYYTGIGNNVSALSQMFKKLSSDNKYYFTIKNTGVVAYNGKVVDSNIKVSAKGEGEFNYIASATTSYKRIIYVVSENHRHKTENEDVKSHSYISIEINKDNARGSVYYLNDNSFEDVPSNGEEDIDGKYKKLQTGNDWIKPDGEFESGIHGAGATSAKHVAFVWNMGTGSFEVESVTYKFYTLKPNNYSGKTYYYYHFSDGADLYDNGRWTTSLGAELMADNVRGIVKFNRLSDSKAGLYVVTRKYKEVTGADLGDDVRERNYYFIVDRNGIIETGIGENIRIELMEGESDFNSFSTQGTDYNTFTFKSDGIDADRYNVYLTTTKLPATLNIPTGKYYTGKTETSANYEAGQLNLSVYFIDKYKQLSNQFRSGTVKIYDSLKSVTVNKDTFVVDVYSYLSTQNVILRDLLTESERNNEWLFLPGDYVIRITDNVVDPLGENHVKYIGLRIASYEDNGPEVEIFNGYAQEEMNKVVIENNSATVSQEFLKVVLPAYDSNETKKAQVDKNYIVVDQFVNSVRSNYIYHDYKPNSGILLTENSKYVTINNNGTPENKDDDSINVWLNTNLRNQLGEIDYENLNKSLSYNITVRYKLNNYDLPYDDDLRIDQLEKYKNCYVYYTANGVKVSDFYYKTYTIVIDREAPGENVKYLNNKDKLVDQYNEEFGSENMIEKAVHETNTNIYFTKQYDAYYKNGRKASNLYVYEVNENTPFNITDVDKIHIRNIEDIKNVKLNLPLINSSYYTKTIDASTLVVTDGVGVYGGLSLIAGSYYEIAEVDGAGNVTQYLIKYTDASSTVKMPFSVLTTLNESKQLEISSNTSISENIFEIKPAGEGNIERTTYFFEVELSKLNGETIYRRLTNLETDFSKLTTDISNKLTEEGFGSFSIRITTINNQSVSHIKLYNEEIIDSLETIRLVKDQDNNPYVNSAGKEIIKLDGANKTEVIDGQTVEFYATEIIIKIGETETTYVAHVHSDGKVKYYEKTFYEENKEDETALKGNEILYVELRADTTYLIRMKDVFGDLPPYRFNTSGYEFVVVEYEDVDNDLAQDFYHEVSGENHMYYGYTNAALKYDKTIYTTQVAYKQFGSYQEYSQTPESVNDVYNQYTFEAPNNMIAEYRVRLYYNGELELTYFIVIDTRLSNVGLRDSSSGEERDLLAVFNNVDYSLNSVRSFKPGSGRLTLYWSELEENNYFDYDYRLYEILKDNKGFRKYELVDGFYIESENGEVGLNLNGKTSTVIATKEDSEGIYKFVISVYGKDGTYLGNRVFAFEVQEVNTQVYYVINTEGEEIELNSSFKYNEDPTVYTYIQNNPGIFMRDGKSLLNENVSIPLYITNQEYRVQELSLSVKKESVDISLGDNKLSIFRISKEHAYDIFLGVLKIVPTSNLVTNVKVETTHVTNVNKQTSLTVVANKIEPVIIRADKVAIQSGILAKNKLMIDVLYDGKYVLSQEFNSSYEVKGNGQYSFIFKDLAGNVHEYTEDLDKNAPETEDKLDVCVLREVVVLLNGEAPIKNAFYNGQVEMVIYGSSKYTTGSISVKATKNGKTYKPAGSGPYIFSEYGTYKVRISARYEGFDGELTKVVTFTILNKNEARSSIDLTGLVGCEITKVLNPKGEDKTTQFLNMLNTSTTSKGLNVSYDAIVAYEQSAAKENKLNIALEKTTFTVTFEIEDMIYPRRELTVVFTLNNEIPTVACSLDKGESSTKGFTISFNSAVIYQQIGDSYIYINDKLVATIDENSINENREQKVKLTYKNSGDGDYYVKLVSSSGVILDSYKVTIDEPLNAGAIIVIIVIVGLVLTVVITVIMLRRKMRIR